MVKSMIRKIALVGMLIADVSMLGLWWLADIKGLFWMFVVINIVVIAFELINNFWWYGKTLSTEAKHKITESKAKRAYAYLALLAMMITMSFLAIHLGVV